MTKKVKIAQIQSNGDLTVNFPADMSFASIANGLIARLSSRRPVEHGDLGNEAVDTEVAVVRLVVEAAAVSERRVVFITDCDTVVGELPYAAAKEFVVRVYSE